MAKTVSPEESLFTKLTWGRTKGGGRREALFVAGSVVSFQRTFFPVVCRDESFVLLKG